MKALVTGGAGFIGSHLCQRLLVGGVEVISLDNLVCGRLKNLDEFKNDPNFNFVQADIRDRKALLPAMERVDWVFHLAGLANIVPSIENPSLYFDMNVNGTLHVLECAREIGVSRFLYAASSSSYGIPDNYPTGETAPINPQYPYALTKRLGEELVMHFSKVYKLNASSLRFFNVYGPRARTSGTYGAVFGVFLAQKIAKKIESLVKSTLLGESDYFESLNFRYFGPIDGHDVGLLVKTLNDLKKIPGPKILHCITTKGKGFVPAEKGNTTKWHAPGLFDKTTGEIFKSPLENLPPKY